MSGAERASAKVKGTMVSMSGVNFILILLILKEWIFWRMDFGDPGEKCVK